MKRLRELFVAKGHTDVDISTVDGFQGREKEIIFLSCVRGVNTKTIGFLRDTKRINVAITRARDALYIVGCAQVLEERDKMWKRLIESAHDRECFYDLTTPEKPTKKRKGGAGAYQKPAIKPIAPEFLVQTAGEEIAMERALQEAAEHAQNIMGLDPADAHHEDAERQELNRQYGFNQAGSLDGEVDSTDLALAHAVGVGGAPAEGKPVPARTVSFNEKVEEKKNDGTIFGSLKKCGD